VLGTLAALGSAWIAHGRAIARVAAIAGALGREHRYYALVVVRGARGHLAVDARASAHRSRAPRLGRDLAHGPSVAAEFGPAEVVRLVPRASGAALGASLAWGATSSPGSSASSPPTLVFYRVAIVSFETGRRIILPDGGLAEASADEVVSEFHSEGPLR
jgi:hypothetical protein